MRTTLASLLLFSLSVFAQIPSSPASNPFQPLSFLEGTWSATAQGNGGAAASGSYTFRLELANHFLSDGSTPGTQFRLTYALKGDIMSGKFQMQMPGHTSWNPYLEWSGSKK